MKIEFENLGSIDKGSIELNDFTIFCGKNNSGKTYAMYSVYGLLNQRFNIKFDFVKPIVDILIRDGSYRLDISEIIAKHKMEMIDHIEKYIEKNFNNYLPSLFGVSEENFSNTKVKLQYLNKEPLEKVKIHRDISYYGDNLLESLKWKVSPDDDKVILILNNNSMFNYDEIDGYSTLQEEISDTLKDIILHEYPFSERSFLLPAERAGINLFYKELFSIRNLLLQQAQNDNINPIDLLKDVLKSRYAKPVKDYLQFLNKIGIIRENKSEYLKYAKTIQDSVLGGKYEVDDFGNVSFLVSDDGNKLPLHFTSSTIKTLFGLVFYLQHYSFRGDYLMIDEPELNLHPDNQRQVARILAQLVNAGLKVVVSTHSNYFIREINNLIMLKNEFKGVAKLRKKYKYQIHELLDSKRISAYLFDNNQITAMQIDEEGIIAETFDTVTDALNQSSNDIYYTVQDAKEIDD